MKKFKAITMISMVLIIVTLSSAKNRGAYSEDDVKAEMRARGWNLGSNMYADLTQSQSCNWWYRYFTKGYSYKIVAFSEDGAVNDVDIQVQYEDGSPYVKDTDESDYAVVSFYRYSTERLRIKVTNYDSDTPYDKSKIKFIVFYKSN